MRPTRAMVLAAGLGTRMRPITDVTPKPLVSVGGRTMLDRALDHLDAAGIGQKVVNVHWLADKVEAHLKGRRDIAISDERAELLETGGGVARALTHFEGNPFIVANADIIWLDGPEETALSRLMDAWDGMAMDALLLMQPTATAFGYDGRGDFFLDQSGHARRRGEAETSPYLFAGVQILHPRLFEGCPAGAFSLNKLYDKALAQGRLYGIVHDGEWYHVGTPGALDEAEAIFAKKALT